MSTPINVSIIRNKFNSTPSIIIDRNSDIVKYGNDNRYPYFLLDLSEKSSLHSSILDKKVKMLLGEGIEIEDDDEKTKQFVLKPNPNENLNDIMEKCAKDLEIFGGFSLEIIWTKDKQEIAEIYHLPFQNIRSGKKNENGFVENYFYYNDWKKYTRYNQADLIKYFGYKDRSNRQLLYSKRYTPSNFYYPIPSYIGGIYDISTLHDLSVFHNTIVNNEFQGGMMIIFRGPQPSEEEQDKIVEKIEQKYKGVDGAGNSAIFFMDSEQQEPKIEPIDVSDLDKKYTTLTGSIKESVVMAHNIPRILASLEVEGSLGGSKEIIENENMFYNSYVKYNQDFLVREFNKILKVNKLKEISIKNRKPDLFLYSEQLLMNNLTQDEIRNYFGYPPLEKSEEKINMKKTFSYNGKKVRYDFETPIYINKNNAKNNIPKANKDEIYRWETKFADKPCPICKSYNGQIKSLREWMNKAIPGIPTNYTFSDGSMTMYQTNPYGTYCEDVCRCNLVKLTFV